MEESADRRSDVGALRCLLQRAEAIAGEEMVCMDHDHYYETATKRNLGVVTPEEQRRLRRSTVAIAGMGGGGGNYLTALTRMGIGRFKLSDFDTFDPVNVNRQAGAAASTFGRPKVEVMAKMARDIHPGVEIDTFDAGIHRHNVEEFVRDADVVIDALDIFSMPARRLLHRSAKAAGKTVLFGAPPGFSCTLNVFTPSGMSFDAYFDIRNDMSDFHQIIALLVGMAPAGTHLAYTDFSRARPDEHAAPSIASAMYLTAGLVATEALVVLLQRRPPFAAPAYQQFDPFRGIYRRGRLHWGNRGPLQRLKRLVVSRRLREFGEQVHFDELRGAPSLAGAAGNGM